MYVHMYLCIFICIYVYSYVYTYILYQTAVYEETIRLVNWFEVIEKSTFKNSYLFFEFAFQSSLIHLHSLTHTHTHIVSFVYPLTLLKVKIGRKKIECKDIVIARFDVVRISRLERCVSRMIA